MTILDLPAGGDAPVSPSLPDTDAVSVAPPAGTTHVGHIPPTDPDGPWGPGPAERNER